MGVPLLCKAVCAPGIQSAMLKLCVLAACLAVVAQGATRVSVKESWYGGFKCEPCIPITKSVHAWKAHIQFSMDVDNVEAWNSKPSKISSREFLLDNDWETLNPGSQLCFTFIGRTSGDVKPNVAIWIEGMNGPDPNIGSVGSGSSGDGGCNTGGGSNMGSGSSSKKDYGIALAKSILFYDAQRSGKLPANNPIPWRGDSALGDCVTGGWYDAGDHVKFGLPMGASTHLLAWSLVKFRDGYVKAGQLDMMLDMIRWPLDYFMKGFQGGKFIAQVGDGNADHAYWGRAEDMNMARPCKWIEGGTPGADIAGGSVAALAAASIGFRQSDAGYADRLLNSAKGLYNFAKSHRGTFSGSAPFYGSSGDKDEMCLAGVWLYKATKDQQYLNDARSNAETGTAWSLSWDDTRVACQILMYEETKDGSFKGAAEAFFNSWMPGSGMTYTPCGQAWRDKWGANRYAGNAAFAALVAAEAGIMQGKLRTWANELINFLLGDNRHDGGCYSYEIGYGSKFPRHPHHRGASTTGQQLNGALVGGPDQNDNYNDDQNDYVMNEVATDYNSGFHGALAALASLDARGQLPRTNNKCPCN